jgi:hypothetical protein
MTLPRAVRCDKSRPVLGRRDGSGRFTVRQDLDFAGAHEAPFGPV